MSQIFCEHCGCNALNYIGEAENSSGCYEIYECEECGNETFISLS